MQHSFSHIKNIDLHIHSETIIWIYFYCCCAKNYKYNWHSAFQNFWYAWMITDATRNFVSRGHDPFCGCIFWKCDGLRQLFLLVEGVSISLKTPDWHQKVKYMPCTGVKGNFQSGSIVCKVYFLIIINYIAHVNNRGSPL